MSRYQTILFDADNTLFDFDRAEHEALFDALFAMGVTPTEEMAAVYSAINDACWKQLERGEIDKVTLRERRFSNFCARYGLSLDVPRLSLTYTDCLATKPYLIEGALAVCEALAARCRLYIITNGIESVQKGRFERSPLRPLIRQCFISGAIGYEKPRREFFDAVAAATRYDPKTTLVVGDSLSSDIKGGIAAGLDTCWFNAAGKEAPAGLAATFTVRRLSDVVPVALGY